MFNNIKDWMTKNSGRRYPLWVVHSNVPKEEGPGVVHELCDSSEPEYVAQCSLKVTLTNNTIIGWTRKLVDSPTIGQDMQNSYSDFSQWYNNPQPTQHAHHYVMHYDSGETMIRRADIVSYNIEWKYIDDDS